MWLTKDATPEVRACIDALATATSDTAVTVGIDRLRDTLAQERRIREEQERERRRRTGIVALAPEGAAQEAADEFNAMREAAIAAQAEASE